MKVSDEFRDQLIAAIPSLRAFAVSLCGNATRADDLVQETLVKAWANHASFEPGTNLRAWLYTILRNEFYSQMRKKARETGVVKTMFGRRRLVPDLTSRNYQIRTGAERYAVNFPIQGSAADILKRAMIDVHRELKATSSPARMILTVHDELLFEAPKEAADETSALVRERMEAAVQLAVPLTVEVGVGENWKEAKG